MRQFCSKGPCTAVGIWVLIFDAAPTRDDTIGIRAQVHACERHRDELAQAVKAYSSVDAGLTA